MIEDRLFGPMNKRACTAGRILGCLSILIIGTVAMACSPRNEAVRFTKWYEAGACAEFDRDCVLSPEYGVDDASCHDDMSYSIRNVDGTVMEIVITGSFTGTLGGVRGEYRYHIKESYVLLGEYQFHFCPDTVTFTTTSGEVLSVLPPYFWNAHED